MSNQFLFHVDPPSVADTGDEITIQARFRSRLKSLGFEGRIAAVPNGGKRTAWAAMQAQKEGLAKGHPDLNVYWAGGGKAHLEFKARSGSLKPEQIEWLNWLHQSEHPCGVFRSVDTAIDFLREQGAPFLFLREAA